MKLFTCITSIALLCTLTVVAGPITLVNPGYETGDATGWYSPQGGVPAPYTHAAGGVTPLPPGGGTHFCYYSPGDFDTTWFAQEVQTNFVNGDTYTFSCYFCNGGSANAAIEIGYLTTPGDWNTYSNLNRAEIVGTLPAAWTQLSVSYTADAGTDGSKVVVCHPTIPGNSGGLWTDVNELSVIPEPALGLFAIAALFALIRRK